MDESRFVSVYVSFFFSFLFFPLFESPIIVWRFHFKADPVGERVCILSIRSPSASGTCAVELVRRSPEKLTWSRLFKRLARDVRSAFTMYRDPVESKEKRICGRKRDRPILPVGCFRGSRRELSDAKARWITQSHGEFCSACLSNVLKIFAC